MGKSDLDVFFKPRSIALVGLPRGLKAGKVFLLGLMDQGFDGTVYPIHPTAEEIDGLKAFRSLDDVPGEVDMAIIMSPKETVMDALKGCAKKKVKAVVLYTSGFSELGGDRERQEEARMQEIARAGGFRIIGPNCMGIYSPASKIASFPGLPRVPGKVGFLSQSGSLIHLFVHMCGSHMLYFSHAVSYGNSCDVDLYELVDRLYTDDDTQIICSYCEGVKNGEGLIKVMRENALKKPFIMWKVGKTSSGMRAASSHTGSLSGPDHLWKGIFHQYGITEVKDIEELMDTVMAFYHLPLEGEGRVVIVSGPGGPAVSAADAAELNDLSMAYLADNTIQELKAILPPTGTSIKNPIDVGMSASFDLRLYLDTLDALARDKGVDAIIIVGGGATDELTAQYIDGLVRIKNASGKAIIAVSYPGFIQDEGLLEPLYTGGIPVYTTPERALRAYSKLVRFHRLRKARRS